MNCFTLPIRRWLALALVVTFFVPFMVTEGVVARQAWRQHGGATAAANPWWSAPSQPVQKPVIPGSQPRKTAIYAGPLRSPGQSWLMHPLVYLSTLLLTLGVIAWFLGRTVLQPLSATSRAARQIAVGNLGIVLPLSRVREVAEVGAAFEAMSATLQESLQHQAELEEERRFFVSAIAHDLRTPLFSLRGYLEGMEKGIADTPRKRMHHLEVAQEKAAALERLVSDLFAYTRAEYPEQTLQRERLELGPLMERVADGLSPLARTKDVEVALAGPAAADARACGAVFTGRLPLVVGGRPPPSAGQTHLN